MKAFGRATARRYAQALLEVAAEGETKGGTSVEGLGRDLRDLVSIIRDHHELGIVLGHPAITPERKKAILGPLLERAGAAPELRRLVDILAEADRLGALGRIAEIYVDRANARRGIAVGEAVSATPLDPAQVAALAAALGRTTGSTVELRPTVDPELQGGLLVRLGGLTYDGSVRSRLRQLRRTLVPTG